MSSCLGIYVNNDVVKYAKLSYEKNNLKLEQYGTRFVKLDKLSLIESIIQETNSANSKIAITPEASEFINLEIYDQGQVKSYFNDIAKMEFEAWCERTGKSATKYNYIYKVSDAKNANNKRNLALNVVEKELIDKYTQRLPNISSIYPACLLTNRLVSKDEHNYILVDLSDTLTVQVVIEDKMVEIQNYKIGMKQILQDFSGKLGSYQKAYEACKQINVFSEGVDNNNKELESLLEPLLQEVLKDVQFFVNQYKRNIDKIILTGTGIIFTNIDILFTEFLEEKCEILKPEFIEDTSNVRNTADMLEAIAPMALAYDLLIPAPKESEYVKGKVVKQSFFGSLFAKKDKDSNKPVKTGDNSNEGTIKSVDQKEEKTFSALLCVCIVICMLFVSYLIFGNIYNSKVENMKKEIDKTIASIDEDIKEINSDYSYIDTNTKKYKEINDDVEEIVEQIESNQIGKFSTYNVATFLQNIIKIIPKNVQLVNISSDDNKNIKMTASSSSYADLGYFVSELKINGTLNDIKVNKVTNGTTTVVEIGGELP